MKCKLNSNQSSLVISSLYKYLIVLGDLARYLELYSDKNGEKDYSQAAKFYHKAIDCSPTNGNAHNQLAVLATYKNDELEAVYRYACRLINSLTACDRYIRSLTVAKPFASTKENLIILFDKNKQKFNQARSLPPYDRFIIRFIKFIGHLYTKKYVSQMYNLL